MHIREASDSDLEIVLQIERDAFGTEEEALLVRDLLHDKSAKPALSLLAFKDDAAVGHILFSNAHLEPQSPLQIALLAPMAVHPDHQKQGIGGQLIRHGLNSLRQSGVDLAFVLGDPNFYGRFGFEPAHKQGFHAPYPIPEEQLDAWMVYVLKPGGVGSFQGTVICADSISEAPVPWSPKIRRVVGRRLSPALAPFAS